MTFFEDSDFSLYVAAASTFILVVAVLLGVKRLLHKRLLAWASRTDGQWDDALVKRIHGPLNLIIVALALGVSVQLLPVTIQRHPAVAHGNQILLIIGLFWILDRVVSVIIRFGKLPIDIPDGTKLLLANLAKTVIYALGALIVLDTVGISITPVLASLGVGSIAVALALQDTLSNFFSGVYVLIDKPVRTGDYVRIDQGMEGVVRKIGWRSTRIEAPGTNTIIIPNSKLSSSTLMNYDMPISRTVISVEVGVDYDSDLPKVEKVIQDVAREAIQNTPGGFGGSEPQVRFHTLGASSINLSVSLPIEKVTDGALVRHEFIKRLQERCRRERISLPFPQQVVHQRVLKDG